ncbi:MAG TPA: hypothetical protein VLK79_09150 [Gaiellales bacterium]|nr:hypothetical protein [Gaiellales bacterium]
MDTKTEECDARRKRSDQRQQRRAAARATGARRAGIGLRHGRLLREALRP